MEDFSKSKPNNETKAVLLSTACFPSIQYLSKLLQYNEVYIDQYENFNKQSYRNRYLILSANGPESMVVPVIKGRGKKIKIKDLQIAYDTHWQRNHWRTLFSAYNNSPYFEYYKDDIFFIFEKRHQFLLEMNLQIHQALCNLLDIKYNLQLTTGFQEFPANGDNLREAFSPKIHKNREDAGFFPQKYTQVFSEKLEFVPNLSVLDLLFNEGPNSLSVLLNSRTSGEIMTSGHDTLF